MRNATEPSLETRLEKLQSTALSAKAILLMVADHMPPGDTGDHAQMIHGVADLMDRIVDDAEAAMKVGRPLHAVA